MQSTGSLICPSELKISTITLCAKLSSVVNLDLFNNCYKKTYGYLPCYSRNNKSKKNKKKKEFMNSVTINEVLVHEQNINRLSIKIFKSGSIQITGCRKITSIDYILKFVKDFLFIMHKKYMKLTNNTEAILNLIDEKDYRIISSKIAMINSNFKIGISINRDKLYKYLLENITTNVFFNRDSYHAINLKLNNETVLIFHTGSILITGGASYCSCKNTYKDIINIIQTFLLK